MEVVCVVFFMVLLCLFLWVIECGALWDMSGLCLRCVVDVLKRCGGCLFNTY